MITPQYDFDPEVVERLAQFMFINRGLEASEWKSYTWRASEIRDAQLRLLAMAKCGLVVSLQDDGK